MAASSVARRSARATPSASPPRASRGSSDNRHSGGRRAYPCAMRPRLGRRSAPRLPLSSVEVGQAADRRGAPGGGDRRRDPKLAEAAISVRLDSCTPVNISRSLVVDRSAAVAGLVNEAAQEFEARSGSMLSRAVYHHDFSRTHLQPRRPARDQAGHRRGVEAKTPARIQFDHLRAGTTRPPPSDLEARRPRRFPRCQRPGRGSDSGRAVGEARG